MAQLEPPSPQDIITRANVPAAMLGLEDDSDILLVVGRLLRPVVRSANGQVDMASLPYDFPFDDVTLALAFPDRTTAQRGETVADQQGEVTEWIADQVCYELLRTARPRGQQTNSGDYYQQKAKDFKESAEQHRKVALEMIARTVALTTAGGNAQAQQARPKHLQSVLLHGSTRAYADSVGAVSDDLIP